MPAQETAATTVGDSPPREGADGGSEPHPDRRLLIDGELVGADQVINGGNYFAAETPFGGFKHSGIGREMGVAGLEEFLERKTLAVPAVPAGSARGVA